MAKIKKWLSEMKEDWLEPKYKLRVSNFYLFRTGFCEGTAFVFWFYVIALWIIGLITKQRVEFNWAKK